METKDIKVGDFVRGFKTNSLIKDKCIGEIGEVVWSGSESRDKVIGVKFNDGTIIEYAKAQAIEHLCNSTTLIEKDNINPQHYKRLPKETIERIQDNLTEEEFKGYIKGNILKYLDRFEYKNGVEDLKKANWYLNKLIELENG